MPLPPRSMLSPFQAALITVTTTKKRGSKDMKIIIVLVTVQYTEEERRIDEKDHHTVHRRHNAKCLFRANQQLLRLLLVGSSHGGVGAGATKNRLPLACTAA